MRAKEIKRLKELSAEVVGMYFTGFLPRKGTRVKLAELNCLIQSIEGRKPARPKVTAEERVIELTNGSTIKYTPDEGATMKSILDPSTVEPIAHHPV